MSFILAGEILNVIDKIVRGYVAEIFDVTQVINLPVFNIADLFILIEWVSIAAIFASFIMKELRKKKTEKS